MPTIKPQKFSVELNMLENIIAYKNTSFESANKFLHLIHWGAQSTPSIPKDTKVEKYTEIENNPDLCVSKEAFNIELERMDAMFADPKCEHCQLLEQIYLILMMLYNKNEELERKSADDKESVLFDFVSDLKGTYNTWSSLGIAVTSGLLQVGGGLMGVGSFAPGANSSLKKIGKLVSGVGQGSSGLGQVATNRSDAKRLFVQHLLDETKRNRSQFDEKSRQAKDNNQSTQNSWKALADLTGKCARTVIGAAAG